MNLQSQLTAVRQRWWVVLASVMIALGVAGFVTVRAQPRYTSSVTFFFVTTPDQGVTAAYQGSLFVQQRTRSYADLLTSDRLAQSVAADPAVGLTAGEIQSRISTKMQEQTVLVQAVVTDRDPARALRLTEALATQFVKLVQSIETPPGAKDPLVKIEVVSGPRANPDPVSPNPTRNLLLGGLLGLVLGIGLAILRGMVDTAVRTGETLARLTGAPLIGEIPYDKSMKSTRLIVGGSGQSPRAEAMRKLRTNLRFVDLQEPARVVAVTSALQGEGKTTTACNLAIALSEAGWQVLLVDADLRRPQVAEYLGLNGRTGLTDVLLGEIEVADAVQTWGDRSLLVLPAGSIPPNPSELLGSKGMADLLASLKDSADIVIVDTAPLLAVTDGVVVSVQADGALLVTRHGSTSQAQVVAAEQALRAVDARLLGCVLNMAKVTRGNTYQYKGYWATGAGRTATHSRHAVASTHDPVDVPAQTASQPAPAADVVVVASSADPATQEFTRVPR
jgi:capsular exopolysaccharide synthesis family protein